MCKVNETKCLVAKAYKKKKHGHKYKMANKNWGTRKAFLSNVKRYGKKATEIIGNYRT